MLYQESLALRREIGDEASMAATLNNLGITAMEQGALAQAQVLYAESLQIFRRHGNLHSIAVVMSNLGDLALSREDGKQARVLHRQSLQLRRELGTDQGAINALEGLAAATAIGGAPADAAMLWGAATALRESYGMVMPPSERDRYTRRVATAQAQLDRRAWASAWTQGQALSLEQAVACALGADEKTEAGSEDPCCRDGICPRRGGP